jgi:hypothetical protein
MLENTLLFCMKINKVITLNINITMIIGYIHSSLKVSKII